MDYKKDRRLRSIIIKVGYDAIKNAEALAQDTKASSPAALATELTQAALVISLVLIPIGLYYLNNANTSGMPASQVTAVGAIGIIIIVAIILAVLSKAMHKK
jgi:hypothetical protein